MKGGVPDRGDILHLDLDPASGREQRGRRYVMVLTVSAFNRFGLALVAPITQGGTLARENGFTVSLLGSGGKVQGVALCNQLRMLDFKQQGGELIESVPTQVIEEVLARVSALLE